MAGRKEGLAVQTTGLAKAYGDRIAVAGVDLEVREGEVFAFLGPNGAGKSTTINLLCTLLSADGGSAWVAGADCLREPAAVRERIGLVFQERTLDAELTAEENLRFHAILYGIPRDEIRPRTEALLLAMGLADRGRDLVATYSSGMARRLELARAMLHAPRVLFLDEPTLGLDPTTRTRFWADLLRMRTERGFTVFFSTHSMEEAESADRVAILHAGRIVAVGTPAELKSLVGLDQVHISTKDPEAAAAQLRQAGYAAKAAGDEAVVAIANGAAAVPAILRAVAVPVGEVRVQRPTLEDVFLRFTGHGLGPPSEGT